MSTFEYTGWYYNDDNSFDDDEVSLYISFKLNGIKKVFEIRNKNINRELYISGVYGFIPNNDVGRIYVTANGKTKEIMYGEYFTKYFTDDDARKVAEHLYRKIYG